MSDMGPAENIMHCTIKVGDSTIMVCDDPRPDATAGSGNISLAIGLNDPERAKGIFGNLAKGGSVIMPLEKTYWAEAFGMVADKFGVARSTPRVEAEPHDFTCELSGFSG